MMMRSRRMSARVTPIAGGEAEHGGDGAGAGLVDAEPIRDELECHGDESPRALEQEGFGDGDVRDERRQHDPDFRDRRRCETRLPRTRRVRCGRAATVAPRRSALRLREWLRPARRTGRLASTPSAQSATGSPGRVRAAQTPKHRGGDNRRRRPISAIRSRPFGTFARCSSSQVPVSSTAQTDAV